MEIILDNKKINSINKLLDYLKANITDSVNQLSMEVRIAYLSTLRDYISSEIQSHIDHALYIVTCTDALKNIDNEKTDIPLSVSTLTSPISKE
jgi:hypothetical protein